MRSADGNKEKGRQGRTDPLFLFKSETQEALAFAHVNRKREAWPLCLTVPSINPYNATIKSHNVKNCKCARMRRREHAIE